MQQCPHRANVAACLGRQAVRTAVAWALLLLALIALVGPAPLAASEFDDCRALLARGEYQACLDKTTAAISGGVYGEHWHILKTETELTLGRYEAARQTIEAALPRYSWSLRLHWLARDAYRFTGQAEKAAEQPGEIAKLVEGSPWRYTDADNLVALGQLALDLGADAKQVQDAFFQRAKRNNPSQRGPVLALGNLALAKRDLQLAAEIFAKGTKDFPDDADMQFGLAQALMDSDSEAATQALMRALELNPRHVPCLLLQTDRLIDGEEYAAADQAVAAVLAVNPQHPEALAFQAAMAHLRHQESAEQQFRTQALSTWKTNPVVDYLIGRELSQKYRFAEGAAHQRQALTFDAKYLPARKQLAEDLLRLGQEQEGWQLADAVFETDGYDVAMYNLVTLRDELARFTTLETPDFLVRMDAHEAVVYGPQVLDLLQRAKQTLCAKYGLALSQQVIVEIFPKPADFAVRTFGIPGVSGYLGVCFGNVITANSPASQGASPTNWESVLWHEFAHVVTLHLTRNRMPRWLSEGISVYEELQHDPRWGQRMTPAYRELVLAGDFTPVGELSGAFLKPGGNIAFAYYESALVVEYVVQTYGFESLLHILHDLGTGVSINDALTRHTAPLEQLEAEFAEFIQDRADALGQNVDWSTADLEPLVADANAATKLRDWAQQHPTHYRGLSLYADFLLQRQNWDEAQAVLRQLIALCPQHTGRDSAYVRLADVYHRLGETDAERELLIQYVAVADDASAACLRLLELETAREDWEAVRTYARQMLAINPLVPQPHRALAAAAEHLPNPDEARAAYESLLALAPADPAEIHFRLARLFHIRQEDEAAKRHVLQALEEAPRYREALRLLLEITRSEAPAPAANAIPEEAAAVRDTEPALPATQE